ncbi:MAG TPA: hypothetical protein VKU41_20555 [Polyangiaceae bacterium]|nr:hypothetical protein [Polyangiaceae bacterium]
MPEMPGSHLIEQKLEQFRSLFANHDTDGDRRYELTRQALSGLVGSMPNAAPADIAMRAVEIADAALRLLNKSSRS